MQLEASIPDVTILTMALAITQAKTEDEKIQILFDNSITGYDALETAIQQLSYLDEALVWDFFMKDDLICRTEAAAEENGWLL